MKRVGTSISFDDLFAIVAGIAEDNELHTVDDLCDHLEQNSNEVYTVTRYARGESHDN